MQHVHKDNVQHSLLVLLRQDLEYANTTAGSSMWFT